MREWIPPDLGGEAPMQPCYLGRLERGRLRLYGPDGDGHVPIDPVKYGDRAMTAWGANNDYVRGTAIAWLAHYLTRIVRYYPANSEGERRQWIWARQHACAFVRQLLEHLPSQWDLQVAAVEEFCVLASMESIHQEADWWGFRRSVFEGALLIRVGEKGGST